MRVYTVYLMVVGQCQMSPLAVITTPTVNIWPKADTHFSTLSASAVPKDFWDSNSCKVEVLARTGQR